VKATDELRTPRTSHKIAEQGRRSRINTALKEIKALLPEEIILEGNHAQNGLSVRGESKASTVEMAIAYIKNLQVELESSCQHFLCNIPGCCKAFHRPDLLQRHLERQ
jgi:helix-turn-helix protein